MNEYYVYALIDPRDKSIFYIGKGKGNRYLDHKKNIGELGKRHSEIKKGANTNKLQRIKKIIDSGLEVEYKMIAENLTEDEAFALEEILIDRFGREIEKSGYLTNIARGGNWDYTKVSFEEHEKITIEQIQEKYPKLIPIIEQYPIIAEVPPKIIPWFKQKIPKQYAVFQYSTDGTFIGTHNTRNMIYVGMSDRIIKSAIENNQGFVYGFQWNYTKIDKMRNLEEIDQSEFDKMKNTVKYCKIREVTFLQGKLNYDRRIQEIEE